MTAPSEQCIEDLQYWTRLRHAGFHGVLQFKVRKVCHFGRILVEGKKNVCRQLNKVTQVLLLQTVEKK